MIRLWPGPAIAAPLLNLAGSSASGGALVNVGQTAWDEASLHSLQGDLPAATSGLSTWLGSGLLPGLVALALVILPGAALLAWLGPRNVRVPMGALGHLLLAATLSLSVLPLLMLAADLLQIRLGTGAAWGLLVVSALALAARLCYTTLSSRRETKTAAAAGSGVDWIWAVATLVVVGLIVGVRLAVVRGLQVPLWGDSVQHTVIVQLMLDNGGMFTSWEPYTPFSSFTIHFGFHAATTLLAWLTGADSPIAVVWSGQMWNILAVLTPYLLAFRIAGGGARGRWAGLGAALVAGLLMPMPMFYVNWGRYAQLAGLALLPGALVLLWQAADTKRWHAGALVLAATALAGAFLAYYRIPFFYATFVLAWGLGYLLPNLRSDSRRWLDTAGRLVAVAALALLLALPHLTGLSGGYLDEGIKAATGQVLGPRISRVLGSYGQWQSVTTFVPSSLLILSGLALVWSLVRRLWAVAAMGLWAILMALILATQLIGLPGAGMMNHFAVMISLYLPVSVLLGWLVGEAYRRLVPRRLAWLVAVLLVALGLWGARDRLQTLDLSHALVTEPDLAAMEWIEANTPPDSVFLVNGFAIYGGTSVVGSDAGWWLPLLAGRSNTMPPQYALFNERSIDPGYRKDIVSLVNQLAQIPLTSADGLAAACDMGVTHVYVGQLQGQVGKPPPEPLFTADELLASPAVEPVYHEDAVWVFALAKDLCP